MGQPMVTSEHSIFSPSCPSGDVRRRCTTLDNRGGRRNRNPRMAVLPPCANREHAYVSDTPTAQWNELRTLFRGRTLKRISRGCRKESSETHLRYLDINFHPGQQISLAQIEATCKTERVDGRRNGSNIPSHIFPCFVREALITIMPWADCVPASTSYYRQL